MRSTSPGSNYRLAFKLVVSPSLDIQASELNPINIGYFYVPASKANPHDWHATTISRIYLQYNQRFLCVQE